MATKNKKVVVEDSPTAEAEARAEKHDSKAAAKADKTKVEAPKPEEGAFFPAGLMPTDALK